MPLRTTPQGAWRDARSDAGCARSSSSADGVLLVAGEGRVRFANPAAARLFGRGRRSWRAPSWACPWSRRDGGDRRRPAAAGPARVELRVVEVEWEGGPALLVSLRDVTDRREAEERRRAEREEAARKEAETAARRAAFLSEVSAALSTSLDAQTMLERLARLAVPKLADGSSWCTRGEHGALERIAAAHGGAGPRILRALPRLTWPPRRGGARLRSGRAHGRPGGRCRRTRTRTPPGAAARAGDAGHAGRPPRARARRWAR